VTDGAGQLVTDCNTLAPGDRLELRLSNGAVSAEVRGVRK